MNQNIAITKSALELALNRLMSSDIEDQESFGNCKKFYASHANFVLNFAEKQTDEKAADALCRVADELVRMVDLYNETNDHMIIHEQMIRVGAYLRAVADQYPEIDLTTFKDAEFDEIFKINL